MSNHRRNIHKLTRRHENRPSPKRSPARSPGRKQLNSPSNSLVVETSGEHIQEHEQLRTPSPKRDDTSLSPRTLQFDREDRKVCRTLDRLFLEHALISKEEDRDESSSVLLQETESDFTEHILNHNLNEIRGKLLESLDVLKNSSSSEESSERNVGYVARSVLELSASAAFQEFYFEIEELKAQFGERMIAQNQEIRYLKRRALRNAIDRVFRSSRQADFTKQLAFRSWVGFTLSDRQRKCKEKSVIIMDEFLNRKRLSRVDDFFRVWVDATSRLDVLGESTLSEITLSKAHVYSTKTPMRVNYAFV